LGLRVAGPAANAGRYLLDRELGAVEGRALRDELEAEGERVGHDLAQPADLELDPGDAAAARMLLGDRHDRLRQRQLMHRRSPTPAGRGRRTRRASRPPGAR